MADEEVPFKFKGGFFDLESQEVPEGARPRTFLKTTEWGGLTLVSLLASLAFPPYFVSIMTLAFLNAGGLLWVTHLSEKGRQRLRDFESEFRKGHQLETQQRWEEAVEVYRAIKPRFSEISQLATLCDKRVAKIEREHPRLFNTPKPFKKQARARGKRKK